MKNNQYNHNEAYCLMNYKCDKCNKIEVLWNSRDGVTPFMINCENCNGSMEHINWNCDIRDMHYIPKIGQRIFVSLKSIHERIQHAFNRIEKRWCEISEDFKTMYNNDMLTMMFEVTKYEINDSRRFEHSYIIKITEVNRTKYISDLAKNCLVLLTEKINKLGSTVKEASKAFRMLGQCNKLRLEKMNRVGIKAAKAGNALKRELEKINKEEEAKFINEYKKSWSKNHGK